jgi:hypothetical protein
LPQHRAAGKQEGGVFPKIQKGAFVVSTKRKQMKTNKKTIVRRLASLVLVALLLVTALSACSGKQQVVKPTVNSDVFLSIDENCSLTASELSAIAKMLSSKFGVGNSQFRTDGESGYVDTVPFGAFRREVFTKYGGYDERLVRNQDNEMNYRIRKNGGKIYLARDIRLAYYCRDTIKGIAQMAQKNGMWNVITMKLCPGAMGLRHFIPLAFVTSLAVLIPLCFLHYIFTIGLGLELLLYLTLDGLFSLKKAESAKEWLLLMALFPIFHIAYGWGSVKGLCKLLTKAYRNNTYQPPII